MSHRVIWNKSHGVGALFTGRLTVHEHLHSGIKFVTPASRHNGKDEEILAMRREVYEKAKMSNPNRWSATTRKWEKDGRVYLNRLKGNDRSDTKKAA